LFWIPTRIFYGFGDTIRELIPHRYFPQTIQFKGGDLFLTGSPNLGEATSRRGQRWQ